MKKQNRATIVARFSCGVARKERYIDLIRFVSRDNFRATVCFGITPLVTPR